jgi:hypothetical protein
MTRRSARTILVPLAAGAALLSGGGWLVMGSVFSRRPIDDYVAQARIAGKPVTLREAFGPVPAPEANGAPELLAVWARVLAAKRDPRTRQVKGPWNVDKDPWYEGMSAADVQALEAALAELQPLFAAVAAAVAKPRLCFAAFAADGRSEQGDYVFPVCEIASVLVARATIAANADERLDAAALLGELAGRWEGCTLIDEAGAGNVMRKCVQAIQHELLLPDVDAARWRGRLDAALARPWLPRFGKAVRRERAWFAENAAFTGEGLSFRWYDRVIERERRPPLRRLGEQAEDLVEAWLHGEMTPHSSPAYLSRALTACEPLETAPTDSYEALQHAIAETAGRIEDQEQVLHVSWLATVLSDTDACCRLARIALAMAEFRAQHHDLPAALDDLQPQLGGAVPLDPYSDEPFVFEQTAAGVRVSCVRQRAGKVRDQLTLSGRLLTWELRR